MKMASEIAQPTSNRHRILMEALESNEAAFVTIFYDHMVDSDDLFLATRVLMRSIADSHTRFRKIVIIPEDGIQDKSREILEKDGNDIEILRVDIPNVFLDTNILDPRAQLLHMRNKLILWDDPVLSTLKRIVYLDPENLVLKNMDEIFECREFCAVDNGQSIVYANGLLVITPTSLAGRTILSDAIDSFMISGRPYNYVGISQGFLPGLFQAFEESPLFYDGDGTPDTDTFKSVAHRLPFYYSINHMVFYERMNWDLYQCKEKNHSPDQLPGPLLSYKYSGSLIKPWFWLPYAYFQVFWHWQNVRERLKEDHLGFFFEKFVLTNIIFTTFWFLYVFICVKLHKTPQGRTRRLSSWGLPAPGNVPTISLDIFGSRFVRKACQISCNVLYAVSSAPIFSSIIVTICTMFISIHSIPATMHPRYACKLWMYLLNLLIASVILVYHIADVFRTAQWKRGEAPSSISLLLNGLKHSLSKLPPLIFTQLVFLYVVGRTDLFRNPVLRPTITILLLVLVWVVQVRIVSIEMIRVARK
jgi:hypothetical protein